MGRVLSQLNGQSVTEIPLLNFQKFAPEKVKDLVEVSEMGTSRWRFHTYDISALKYEDEIEQWASWMIHRDLRGISMDNDYGIHVAFHAARLVRDVNYQDALLDALLSLLRKGQPPGSVDVNSLRLNEFIICSEFPEFPQCMLNVFGDLMYDLILHHDAEAATCCIGHGEDEHMYYDHGIREQIPDLALKYFTGPEREPKDPLQLSDQEFCKKYHAHNKEGLSCYRTQRLPGNA
jgi:hypothetical protein